MIYGLFFWFIDSDLKANEMRERNIIHLMAKMCFYQDKIIQQYSELKTLETWISRFILDLLFILIISLHPGNFIKFNQSRGVYVKSQTANKKPANHKFCAQFNGRTLIGRNPVEIFKKRGKEQIKQKKCSQWIFRWSNRYLKYPILRWSSSDRGRWPGGIY